MVVFSQSLLYLMWLKNLLQNYQVESKSYFTSKEGFQIANLYVEDVWKPDLQKESKLVYGTDDPLHPAIDYLNNRSNKIYLAGKIEKILIPSHYDFTQYRLSLMKQKGNLKN